MVLQVGLNRIRRLSEGVREPASFRLVITVLRQILQPFQADAAAEGTTAVVANQHIRFRCVPSCMGLSRCELWPTQGVPRGD